LTKRAVATKVAAPQKIVAAHPWAQRAEKLNKLISRRIINSLTKSSRGSSNLLFEEIVSQVFLSHYKRLFTLLLVASSVFCDP